ncbi:Cystatin domain [Arabidopsis thaliana x Arabidopsis arenosa]|uniref:Cystatin domain n=1 Tax=Arabidopsis thaliana x Arabidopsis arenosa TaxID=1240361 RepID=A0A8T2A639_9BRAS|nr:Cystatin domain [Arabidopsis thaliana x Arabidopsis arenosa]
MEGGWFPIKDIDDPSVDDIAKFAITRNNKKNNSPLKLQTVVSGESQVVCGIIFRLIIDVSEGEDGDSKTYEAEVYQPPWRDNPLVLNYFKLIN